MEVKELTKTCFLPEGSYEMKLVAPKGVPAHKITFKLEKGIFQAQVETEHGLQPAEHLRIQERHILWQQFGGTPGTELFEYDMEIFPGNVMLGKCYRIDVSAEEAPASPVLAEAMEAEA
jgi:hypothetical protein